LGSLYLTNIKLRIVNHRATRATRGFYAHEQLSADILGYRTIECLVLCNALSAILIMQLYIIRI